MKKIGLIGVGVRLRHVVKCLLQNANGQIRVAALCDSDPDAVAQATASFGGDIRICATPEELVGLPDIEWVFVGSYNADHARHAMLALEAGKHVFAEKPLATTLEDAVAVARTIRETGRMFAFGLVLRYAAHYQALKKQLADGAIGTLVSMEFNETLNFNHGGHIFGNWRRHRSLSGGHMLEKCCHDLDLANWLVGSRVSHCASFGGNNFFVPKNAYHAQRIGINAEGKPAYQTWKGRHPYPPFSEGADIVDNQVAILEYANGVRATFHTNCNTALPERRFYLCGTEGTLRADLVSASMEIKRIGFDTEVQKIETGTRGGHGGGDEVMTAHLCGTILRGEKPLAGVEEGLQAGLVAFALNEAMDRRQVVDLAEYYQQAEAFL